MPTGIYKRPDGYKPKSVFKKGQVKHWIGRKHRKESLQKISEAKLGIKYPNRKSPPPVSKETKAKISEKMKGKKNALGYKYSIEERKIISESRKGKNGSNWQGGISQKNRTERQNVMSTIEYTLWREAVFARDNWTDQKTGLKGGKLVAHHIQNYADYPELRTSIENGITLSVESHKEFHRIYGIRNTNREQIKQFLQQDSSK